MTIAAGAVFECRDTATAGNVNGGGFVIGASGVDYSQQDAAQYALTGLTTGGVTDTVSTASAASDMVGNIGRWHSGTNVTQGWYEVIAVVAGVSIQFDRNFCTGAVASGVLNIGGAISLGSTLDDEFFEGLTAGNTVYIKGGNYSFGEQVSIGKDGTYSAPIKILGYDATRGDNPTGAGRPFIDGGTLAHTLGDFFQLKNIRFDGTGTTLLTSGIGTLIQNCKLRNLSTAAGRTAVVLSNNAHLVQTEVVSLRGVGVSLSTTIPGMYGNYIHDSDVNVTSAVTGNQQTIIGNIIARAFTAAVLFTGSITTTAPVIYSNTIYGTAAKIGSGVVFSTNASAALLINNIITGFITGVTGAAAGSGGIDHHNAYYNNTSNVDSSSNWQIGATSLTSVDPDFADSTEVAGTGATTSNTGNTLVKSGETFITKGVTAGRDYCTILVNGTPGKYTIDSVDSETQLTLGQAPGNSSGNVQYSIGIGHDFSINGDI